MDTTPPRRQWWHSFWFAVAAIIFAIGAIALAITLIFWALLPDWSG